MKHLIHFLTILLLALLAACAPAETTGPAADEPADETAAEATAAPEEAASDEVAAAEGKCEEGQRLFDHELLATDPVCIPENPERITLPTYGDLVSLERAGVNVVGGALVERILVPQFPNWEEELRAVNDIGRPINPETLLTLDPDLIMLSEFEAGLTDFDNGGLTLSMFNPIAPTVVFRYPAASEWQQVAEFHFDVVGKMDAYEALVAEYEARAAELASLVGDVEDIEVSVFNVRPGFLAIYGQYSGGGKILEDIGFSRPEDQLVPVTYEEYNENPAAFPDWNRALFKEISLERLDLVDGDFIIIFGNFDDEEDDAQLNEILESPLWQQLNAIQEGRVLVSAANFSGTDLATAHGVLDSIAEGFGVADEFSPNPYEVKAPLPTE